MPTAPTPARPTLWWAFRESAATVVGLGLFALLCLGWFPLALALHPVLPRAWGSTLGRRAAMWGFRAYLRALELFCGCRFDLRALDALGTQGPLVIVANHPSLLDAVLLVSRLPDAVCIMKASLLDNPMFGAGARLARYIRNDALLNVVLRSRQALREGAQVIVFPEGTRTTHFPIDRLQPSIGLLAMRAGAPVQAVFIEFSTPYLGKGWPLWQRPSLPLQVRVRLGRRYAPPTDVAAFTADLQQHFDQSLASDACGAATPPDPT